MYNYGDRVKIISSISKYYGRTATIVREEAGVVYVVPDHSLYFLKGDRSKCLKLLSTSVEFIGKGEKNMKKLTGFKKIAVIEIGDGNWKKDYHYALYDDDAKPGDKVLVTGRAEGKVYEIKDVIIVDDNNKNNFQDIKSEVMCLVDLSKFNERAEKRKEAIKLREQMDKKRKEIEARKNDEYYAELDPEYAEMLTKLKSLQS